MKSPNVLPPYGSYWYSSAFSDADASIVTVPPTATSPSETVHAAVGAVGAVAFPVPVDVATWVSTPSLPPGPSAAVAVTTVAPPNTTATTTATASARGLRSRPTITIDWVVSHLTVGSGYHGLRSGK